MAIQRHASSFKPIWSLFSSTSKRLTLIALFLITLAAISLRFMSLQSDEYILNWSSKSNNCQNLISELNTTGEGTYFWSHDGQDYYTFKNHFINLRRNGTYLDIAAGQPIYASTTYFFDHCLGWRGLCVEANSLHHDKFPGTRSCELIPQCVGSEEGQTVQFHDDDGGSGIVDENYANPNRQGNITTMTCTTVETILRERLISHIDFLSLDVEGHELDVLKGIDFRKIRIDIITVEVKGGPKGAVFDKMCKFMDEAGYYRRTISVSEVTTKYPNLFSQDQLFIHRSVSFGQAT